ncbi:MAG: DUF748 domain-containing protein, partial [Proteobacteria bacterium]|nr:DUF748 domain-containing protein [Pseudomonadota bacterium]
YLPIPENIVLKNAGLNLELQADFQKKNSNNSLLLQGKVNILNVDVKGAPEEDIIKFPTVAVDISSSDIFLNQLNVSKILMAMPELNLSRDKTGKLNLLNYIPPKTATQEKEEGKKPADPGSNPFVLTVSDVEIKDAAVLFQDFANENQFQTRLFPLSVRILNFEAGNRISGEYRLKVETEAKETITSDGRFQTHPVQADGTLELSHILFDKYAPYYENLVNFDVKSGSMNFSTGFEISQNKDKLDIKIKARDFLIQSLAIIDQYDKEEIINIPEFTIKDSFIDVGNKKINTGTIRVQNGNILLKRLKDGQLNLVKSVLPVKEIQNPVNTPVKTNAIQDRTSPLPWAVTMNAFDMTGFNVQFADLTPTDPVRVNLSNISIKAEDLESFGEKKGRVDAQMNWNDKGQIRIKGSMIPAMLKAELDLGLEKIDIKSLQPYFTDSIRILVTDGDINTAGKLKLDMGTQHKTDFKFIGETSITNFICLDKQTATDFFNCNSLYLSGLSVSVFPADITVKDISLTDFYSRIIVSNTGEINLKTIFKKKAAEDQGANSESMPEKTLSEPPQINIESVTLQGGDISFSDHFTQPNFAANMKQIAGSLTGLSSDEQSRAKLHLQGLHGQSSPLDIVGTINPLAKKTFADIDISFKDIELTRFTPYSSKYLGYKIEKGKLILDLEYRIDG